MSTPIVLYIDTTNKRLISSFLSTIQPFQGLTLEAGDLVPVQLHFLTQNPSSGTAGALPYSYIDPVTLTPVSMAVGIIGLTPTAGTFTLTWNASTTSALAYNISASALSTALNALAPITALGGVVVVGAAGGPWQITFNNTGAVSYLFAGNASALSPVSQVLTAEAVAGGTGIAEVQVITLLQNPAALNSTWTATYGAAAVSRLQAGGSGSNEIQRITVPTGSYGGTFSITFGGYSTVSLSYNASASAVQTAITALTSIGANNASVVASSATTWDVTFAGSLAGAGQTLMTLAATGLQSPKYLAGNLNLNVPGVFSLLSGKDSVQAVMQIQQGTSGSVSTVVQTDITIDGTLIEGTPSAPNPVDPWQTLSQVNALIAAAAYSLPTASTTVLGGVKIDNASIVIAAGVISASGVFAGGFGCNTKTAQTAYASGGALAAYGSGAYGFDSGAHASALYALVVAIRAALVANGIMS